MLGISDPVERLDRSRAASSHTHGIECETYPLVGRVRAHAIAEPFENPEGEIGFDADWI